MHSCIRYTLRFSIISLLKQTNDKHLCPFSSFLHFLALFQWAYVATTPSHYPRPPTTHPSEAGLAVNSKDFAVLMDKNDELRHLRDEFCIPRNGDLPGAL